MARSYWNYKLEELETECLKREIHFEEKPDQRTMVHALFDWDKENGSLEEAHMEDEDGKLAMKEDLRKIDPERKMVKVIFHSKDEQDIPYVFIGLNGKAFYLPREKEIEVPRILLRVLDDAIETKFIPRTTGDGKIVYDERRVQRFPYSVLGED